VGTLSSLAVTGNVAAGGITLSGNTIFSTGSTLTIDPSAVGSTGTVVIAGNLSVQGTTTTYDSTTVTINDLLFTVANNAATAAAANGGGIEVGPVGASYATWTYDQPNGRWSTALGIGATGNITGANINGAHFGSGAGLTSIPGANVTGTVPTATSATTAGTVTTAAQPNITSVGTLTALAVSGNASSGTAAADTNTTQLATTAFVIGQASAATPTSIGTNTVGTSLRYARADHTHTGVASLANGGGITASASTGAITLGSTATSANTAGAIVARGASGEFSAGVITATATNARYADLAEMYAADANYAPGTVLIFGGNNEVTISTKVGDPRVVGVVTTNPAHLMNAELAGKYPVAIALIGRVPAKVIGPVTKGDFMVSAGNGVAQACASPALGTVIGKAIQDFSGDIGVIEILINNQ
jgi:hypothetical protein